jgi:hypothetical protein
MRPKSSRVFLRSLCLRRDRFSHPLMRPSLLLILVVSATFNAAGCAAHQPWSSVTIRVVDDTALLQRTAAATSFRTTVVIRNGSSHRLYDGDCGPDAEKEIDNKWVTVWTPLCGGGVTGMLPPGDSAIIPVRIEGFTEPNTYPRLDPRFGPGLYRLIFRLRFESKDVTAPTYQFRASSTFVVKDTTSR